MARFRQAQFRAIRQTTNKECWWVESSKLAGSRFIVSILNTNDNCALDIAIPRGIDNTTAIGMDSPPLSIPFESHILKVN